MTGANGNIPTYPFNLKGKIEMGLRYRIPLPGPFYYSGRVELGQWFPRSSNTGSGPSTSRRSGSSSIRASPPSGPVPALLLAPFYGLFWVICRSLRNRRKCRLVAQCFPVQGPVLQRLAPCPGTRAYGFVPGQRERPTVGGGPFGSDRYV